MTNSSSKVFCVGSNKTGTTSLKAAMEGLGYEFGDPKTSARMAAEVWPTRDFSRLIEYCRAAEAFQDVPFSLPFTFQAMDTAFPGSKFILTIRPTADEWYNSLVRFHARLFSDGRVPPTKKDLQDARGWLYKGRPWQMNRLVFDTPEDDPYQREKLVAFYENHVYSVREYFRHRPGDLLVLDVSRPTAYVELCRFLGKPEENKPFPHRNRT